MKNYKCIKTLAVLLSLVILLTGCAAAKPEVDPIVAGDEFYAAADYENALASFEKAIEKDPANPQGYIKAHNVCIATNDKAKAFDYLKAGYDATKDEGIATVIKANFLEVKESKPGGKYENSLTLELNSEYDGVDIYYAMSNDEGLVKYTEPIEMPANKEVTMSVYASYGDLKGTEKLLQYEIRKNPTGYKWVTEPTVKFINFKKILAVREGLIAFQATTGKWGYMDTSLKVVIAPQYDEIDTFDNDFAWVKKGEKYGAINKSNKTVVPFEYDEISRWVGATILGKDKTYCVADWGTGEIKKEGLTREEAEDFATEMAREYYKKEQENLEWSQYKDLIGIEPVKNKVTMFKNENGLYGLRTSEDNVFAEPQWFIALPLVGKYHEEYALIYKQTGKKYTMGLIQYTYD